MKIKKERVVLMKQKELWINQIKGLCICLVVILSLGHYLLSAYDHFSASVIGSPEQMLD